MIISYILHTQSQTQGIFQNLDSVRAVGIAARQISSVGFLYFRQSLSAAAVEVFDQKSNFRVRIIGHRTRVRIQIGRER